MNTKELEKLLLLEQTGELSAGQRKKLNACPEAAAKREELKALCVAVRPSGEEAPPWAAVKIDARLRTERRSLWLPVHVWKPALAIAATLMIAVNLWTLDVGNEAPPKTVSASSVLAILETETEELNEYLDGELSELESLISAISGDPLESLEI